MEFFDYTNKLKPAKGRILVSEPYLPDPNFERTIILLCEHNEDGSFGFVLNKPSVANIGDVLEELEDLASPVYVGGPVQQDTLHFIHKMGELENAVKIADDIYWGGNFESLKLMISTGQVKEADLKFFLGYSGWSAGQLDEEMDANSWIVSDKISSELIFDTNPEAMWKKSLESMGGKFLVYSNYPVDPRMN